MIGVKISPLWKLHKQLKRAIIDPSLNSSKQMTPVDNAPLAETKTTSTDRPTFNADKGAFPRKPVHEVPCRLGRGARATF